MNEIPLYVFVLAWIPFVAFAGKLIYDIIQFNGTPATAAAKCRECKNLLFDQFGFCIMCGKET